MKQTSAFALLTGPTLRPLQPKLKGVDPAILANAPKWILIVDDEPDILDSVAALVRVIGDGSRTNVRVARSGADALELMHKHFFDMILSDFHLGSMDGVNFLEVAQQLEPGVPFVLMSGDKYGALERLDGAAASNVAFLSKPFEPALLASHMVDGLGWASTEWAAPLPVSSGLPHE